MPNTTANLSFQGESNIFLLLTRIVKPKLLVFLC